MSRNALSLRVLFAVCVVTTALPGVASAVSITLALDPTPTTTVLPGKTADFGVWLQDYSGSTNPVLAFTLDVTASDPMLVAGNYSRFSFTLDPALAGKLSLAWDSSFAGDGLISYLADTPPLGAETGIDSSLVSGGNQFRLGTLSVVAPGAAGTYQVVLTPSADLTNVLVGDPLGAVSLLPGDGTLNVVNSSVTVPAGAIPEPASAIVWSLLAGAVIAARRIRCR